MNVDLSWFKSKHNVKEVKTEKKTYKVFIKLSQPDYYMFLEFLKYENFETRKLNSKTICLQFRNAPGQNWCAITKLKSVKGVVEYSLVGELALGFSNQFYKYKKEILNVPETT